MHQRWKCDTTFGYHSKEYEILFDLKCHCKNITNDNTIDVTESLKIVEITATISCSGFYV